MYVLNSIYEDSTSNAGYRNMLVWSETASWCKLGIIAQMRINASSRGVMVDLDN